MFHCLFSDLLISSMVMASAMPKEITQRMDWNAEDMFKDRMMLKVEVGKIEKGTEWIFIMMFTHEK